MPVFNCSLKGSLDLILENFCNITIINKYGAMAAMATAIFASIYIGWTYGKRARKRKKVQAVFKRSMSVGALHGGELALERMIDYHCARADEASLEAAQYQLQDSLTEKHPDFKKLKSIVAKLEMSGKEEVTVGILETELKRAQKKGKSHEAYEIEMLLVEMQIYKGDFGKVFASECLRHEEISDARRPLYKAISHIMLENPTEESLKCWEEFKDIRIRFQCPVCEQQGQVNKVVTNFNDFEKVIKLLGKDINEARGKNINN